MKPIVTTPNKVLVAKTKKIGIVDQKVRKIIEKMRQALMNADNPKGVGLAAPQIGISLQIFLMKPGESDQIRVFINPEIIAQSKIMLKGIPDKDGHLEGCLSIPKIWGIVNRHKEITIKYLTETNEEKQEKFVDFEAIIVQHEIDHLNGILFTKKAIEQKGKLYKPGVDDEGKEVLEPLEI